MNILNIICPHVVSLLTTLRTEQYKQCSGHRNRETVANHICTSFPTPKFIFVSQITIYVLFIYVVTVFRYAADPTHARTRTAITLRANCLLNTRLKL